MGGLNDVARNNNGMTSFGQVVILRCSSEFKISRSTEAKNFLLILDRPIASLQITTSHRWRRSLITIGDTSIKRVA
jgi:hypothetical protein